MPNPTGLTGLPAMVMEEFISSEVSLRNGRWLSALVPGQYLRSAAEVFLFVACCYFVFGVSSVNGNAVYTPAPQNGTSYNGHS